MPENTRPSGLRPATIGASPARYGSIEVARAVAALAVVAVHAISLRETSGQDYAHGLFEFGQAGVDLFFVISGFVMATVVARPQTAGQFLQRRWRRIVPFYWLFTGLALAQDLASGRSWPDAGTMVRSFLVLPQEASPVLGVGWTLEHEFLFYAITAALLARRRVDRLTHVMIALTLIALAAALFLPAGSGDFHHLFSLYHVEFLIGIAIHRFRHRCVMPAWRPLLLAGILLFPAGAAILHIVHDSVIPAQPRGLAGIVRVVLWGAAGGIVIVALLAAEARHSRLLAGAPARGLAAIGGASYALYLSHPLILVACGSGLGAVWPAALASRPAAIACVVVATAFALAFHHGVERPLLRRFSAPGRRDGHRRNGGAPASL